MDWPSRIKKSDKESDKKIRLWLLVFSASDSTQKPTTPCDSDTDSPTLLIMRAQSESIAARLHLKCVSPCEEFLATPCPNKRCADSDFLSPNPTLFCKLSIRTRSCPAINKTQAIATVTPAWPPHVSKVDQSKEKGRHQATDTYQRWSLSGLPVGYPAG